MPKLLNRADILGRSDRTFMDVKCPEWGGVVRVQSLTGLENDEFEKSFISVGKQGEVKTDNKMVREKLLSWACVDAKGDRLFSDGDVALLAAKNMAALRRLQSAAMKLSGLGDKEVEEIAKNSEAGQAGASSST